MSEGINLKTVALLAGAGVAGLAVYKIYKANPIKTITDTVTDVIGDAGAVIDTTIKDSRESMTDLVGEDLVNAGTDVAIHYSGSGFTYLINKGVQDAWNAITGGNKESVPEPEPTPTPTPEPTPIQEDNATPSIESLRLAYSLTTSSTVRRMLREKAKELGYTLPRSSGVIGLAIT